MVNYITAHSIGEAWLLALKMVIANGIEIQDDKGIILEIIPLYIEIMHPSPTDKIIEKYGDTIFLEFLAKNFGDMTPITGWGYSYAQRLYSHNNTNQIDGVIQRLNSNPYSKSATVSLLIHEHDKEHTPCLTNLDFKIRNETLIMNAMFRSQDIGKKMYGDAIELFKLGANMIQKVPAKKIIIMLTICSAHIYLNDLEKLQSILNNDR